MNVGFQCPVCGNRSFDTVPCQGNDDCRERICAACAACAETGKCSECDLAACPRHRKAADDGMMCDICRRAMYGPAWQEDTAAEPMPDGELRPTVAADLSGTDLSGTDLSGANLRADLRAKQYVIRIHGRRDTITVVNAFTGEPISLTTSQVR